MANSTGPYPAALGFERWQDESPIFRRRFTDVLAVVVTSLPGGDDDPGGARNRGWGYVVLVDGVVVNGRFDSEWTAEDAMQAGIAKAETAPLNS